ncbi:MAG: tyrosine-protein phosphatase, partial [Candidatus Heimdallarchaeota archaeon]|nr:tyrosine-protein phosphatase [Candidatus Heimdallarchaeota archaeon]
MIKIISIVQGYEEPHLEKNELLTKIQSKIPNFRDLAIFNQSYIRPNVIYRSASPIEHQSPELLQDFKDLGIGSIIDLRSAVEIGYASY